MHCLPLWQLYFILFEVLGRVLVPAHGYTCPQKSHFK